MHQSTGINLLIFFGVRWLIFLGLCINIDYFLGEGSCYRWLVGVDWYLLMYQLYVLLVRAHAMVLNFNFYKIFYNLIVFNPNILIIKSFGRRD